MTNTIKLAVSAVLVLSATSAFATNGDHLIGLGAKARGMGGIGIGMSHGAESGLANPALISSIETTEVSFGGTLFMPDVSYQGNPMSPGYADSAADMSMIPEVSIATKVNDYFYWGIGMWGTAGMGVDYRSASKSMQGTANMVTNLQLMQFGVPLTFAMAGFSIGITPILQYGAMDINYDISSMGGGEVGEGVAQDFGFGFNLGVAYEIEGIAIGAVYKSSIEMDYDGQLTSATAPFVGMGAMPAGMINDELEQPAEIGIGASWNILESGNTIALDYKQIQWSSANGYSDFGWEDQDVVILGYEYAADSWAVRLGYNYADQPIKEQSIMAPGGAVINMFNLLGFPATTESHYSVGGTYAFSRQISLDLAYVYAPESTTTFDTAMPDGEGGMNVFPISVKHSQSSVSFGLNYTF